MSAADQGELKLHVFDVGHGDSLLIEFPDGCSFGIVDCHRHEPSHRGFGIEYNRAEPKVLSYFRKLVSDGVKPVVEFACLTHPHIDHYRGYGDLLRGLRELEVTIRRYWDFGASARKADSMQVLADDPDQQERLDELQRLCREQLKLMPPACEYDFVHGPRADFWHGHDVQIDVLAPSTRVLEQYWNFLHCHDQPSRRTFCSQHAYANDDNIASAAFLLRFGNFRLILGGDATNLAWDLVLRSQGRCHAACHAIKVSHHGSLDGSFPHTVNYPSPLKQLLPYKEVPLWPLITAEGASLYALISGGYKTGLPDQRTVESLEAVGAKVLCTGSVETIAAQRYEPTYAAGEFIPDQLAREGMGEVDKRDTSGHGNLVLACRPDGTCQVTHELP